MKEMSKFSFKKYKNGIITIEIQSLIPEKFVNLMWKNGVPIKNLRKENITTMIMDVNLRDYDKIEEIAKKTKTKIKIIKRRGFAFFLIKIKRRIALVLGIILFMGMLYYLSTFVWNIEISVDHSLSPYEIRQQLSSFGIKPGINKRNINVYDIEEKLIKNNENIMWVRARVEGAKLKISAAERQSPPNIIAESSPCNLVARKDGEVIRVYTKAGTPVVKKGDMIRKGQVLVKGEQGKEGATYQVHAIGDVICRTFYEEIKQVKIDTVKRERTGNKIENIYLNIKGKNIYLKKSVNKFNKYDRIEDNKLFIKKEIYYEVKETTVHGDAKKIVDNTANELYSKICANLDKSVKIIDKIVNYEAGDTYVVRVLVVAEENVALEEKIPEQQNQDVQQEQKQQ
ncbi:sporulation protein YqfD [Clostridium aciditolerans]|uniref:Sporulation protein YqfD n=2 Tax=Clostridium aciditolerans TaxID=339861 RepID=A0A934M3L6_9CLOT|nr:sporulation protein YqfD [Clostridium aciditolerans]